MKRSKLAVVVVACMFGIGLSGCGEAPPDAGAPADVIFVGDNIVTMDPDRPTVEAVAVRGETIVATGSMDDVMAFEGASTRVVDLGEQALLPGFIDSHGHILFTGETLDQLSLHSPPVGDVNNVDDTCGKFGSGSTRGTSPPARSLSGADTTTRCSTRDSIPRATIWTELRPSTRSC